MAENRNVKIQMGIILCVYVVWYVTKTVMLECLGIGENLRTFITLPFYIVVGLVGLYVFRKDFLDGLKEWKNHFWKNTGVFIGLMILNPILGAVADIPAYIMWPNATGMNETNVQNMIATTSPVLIILAAGILGPIVEEIIFRILFIKKASSKINSMICVVVSSVLFMLLHCHALTLMEIMLNMDKFVTGILFGSALVMTKNPTVPALVHILNNTFGLVAMMMALR